MADPWIDTRSAKLRRGPTVDLEGQPTVNPEDAPKLPA
jgi:hypothetical protein